MGPRLPYIDCLNPARPKEESSDAERIATHSSAGCFILVGLAATGCQKKARSRRPAPSGQGLPVQTATVAMQPVAQSSEYVATIKSRRSATMEPQVMGSADRRFSSTPATM